MIQKILPLVLALASLALFFFFVIPEFRELKERRAQIGFLNEALSNSRKVQAVRDSLLSSYNTIADADLSRLEKILPDHVDNVRLILEIDRIASRNGMVLQNITTREAERRNQFGPDDSSFGKIQMGFSLVGRYESLVNFLSEIEQSLRLVDVVGLSFVRGQGDLYEYELELYTYWLK